MNALFRSRAFVLLLTVGFVATLPACDAVEPVDTFELDPRRVRFEFRFDGGGLAPDILNEVTSDNAENLLGYVVGRGFAAEDIVNVRVQNARVRVGRPTVAGVNHFDRLELRPFLGTAAGETFLRGQGFTGTGESTELTVIQTGLTNVVRSGPFQAQLLVDPSPQILNAEYFVEVTFDAIIEVEAAF